MESNAIQTDNVISETATVSDKTNGKSIEEIYQKKTQLEHILLRPDTYIGSVEVCSSPMWVFENEKMVYRSINYVPGLYKIFDEILVNGNEYYIYIFVFIL